VTRHLCSPEAAHNTVIDLLAAATAALSHAFNVNAVVLFVKLVAVSTVIALAIATAIDTWECLWSFLLPTAATFPPSSPSELAA
jgi:hypothetical protein